MSTNSIHQRFTLQAIERLKLRKQIETLFQTGEAFSISSLRVIYRLQPANSEDAPVRVGFSIPKKRIKKAVGRNRVRRLLREAWRLQKHELYRSVPEGQQLHLFLVFTGNETYTFDHAKSATLKAMQRLALNINPPAK